MNRFTLLLITVSFFAGCTDNSESNKRNLPSWNPTGWLTASKALDLEMLYVGQSKQDVYEMIKDRTYSIRYLPQNNKPPFEYFPSYRPKRETLFTSNYWAFSLRARYGVGRVQLKFNGPVLTEYSIYWTPVSLL